MPSPIIAISPAHPNGGSPEARKARSIPVPGAVVVAPLTQSWRNYGSAGGSFSLLGAPTLGANGATFNGSTQTAIIDAGASTEFCLVFRIHAAAATSPSWVISTMQPASSYGGYGVFRYDVSSPVNWCVGAPAGTEIASSLAFNTPGVYALTRSGTTLALRANGVQIASGTVTSANPGSRLFLCSRGSSANAFCAATLRNVAQFNSVPSAGDILLLEAWA